MVDGDGNPTQSFLQKTCEGLKSLFRNQHAPKFSQSNKMIKIFASVMALLNVAEGFATNDEGNVTLTQEQMKLIDDELHSLKKQVEDNSKAVNEAGTALKRVKDQLTQAQNDVKQRDEQIAALKGSAGDSTDDKPDSAEQSFTAQDVFNLIKNV